MDKIVDSLKNNRFIQGGIILGGAVAAYYLFLNSLSSVDAEASENDLDGVIMDVLNNAKIVSQEGQKLYDLDSASQIQDLLVQLAIPEFQQFALQSREDRRKEYSTNLVKYFDLVLEYNNRIFSLIGEQQEKLKAYPLYSEECMSIAISVYMQDPEYIQKIVTAVFKLKASLPSTQEISRQDAQSIIAYFIVEVKSEPEILVNLIKYLTSKGHSKGTMNTALKTVLFDQLYFEKEIEEEDYLVPVLEEGFKDDEITKKVTEQFTQFVTEFIESHQY